VLDLSDCGFQTVLDLSGDGFYAVSDLPDCGFRTVLDLSGGGFHAVFGPARSYSLTRW
jgi:hypothetical protein